ncbi:hypothetical protein AN392_02873 [Pseudoalteromonas sp. P1-16-1b]|jgi:predicted small lipoprotein YifL|uniref:LPS translocon maturation chaperone LptM n=1 Tax=Pseudoalteromonas TaxID=53246 RepID=UPI0006BB32C6|nr:MULTISPECIES: lipoprotein [Pseudoalteromonas]MBL0689399.1 lipoprotein [Pseudoalteromonas sp.]KPH89315.1 hypothetical protein AMS57_17485 [Pseudoalteromonas undina]KPZ63918.1 hypothetical protein AN392_02873 [Pseudoalteromonas sp. P1-16-1b]MDN3486011.1 lipoprotein [Pseudoalteromonas sp. APC 3224]TMP53946.1 hypothetical protein CWB78_13005 [Pseudoalteromonas sp. S1612]
MKATYTLQLKQLLISTVLLCALAGCGQSGPLYLPEQPAEQKQPTDIPNKQTPAEQQQEQ